MSDKNRKTYRVVGITYDNESINLENIDCDDFFLAIIKNDIVNAKNDLPNSTVQLGGNIHDMGVLLE